MEMNSLNTKYANLEDSATYQRPKGKVSRLLVNIFNLLNNIFEFEADELHIDDNKYLLSKRESEKRIVLILHITAGILLIFNFLIAYAIWNIQTKTNNLNDVNQKSSQVVVQNLYLIYTNGLTLDLGAHYFNFGA